MPTASEQRPPDMARGSYLNRIAEPLRVGDPVLFSVPQASLEEARPRAASGRPEALRRAAVAPEPIAPGIAPPDAIPGALVPLSQVPVPSAEVAPPQTAGASDAAYAVAFPAQASAAALPVHAEPAPAGSAFSSAVAEPVGSLPPAAQVDQVPSTTPGSPAVPEPGARAVREFVEAPPGAMAAVRAAAPTDSASAVSLQPSPQAAAEPRPAAGAATPPRLHIGTIEVRSTAPQPQPPVPVPEAPPVAPPSTVRTPLARGYGWPFGLAQG